MRFKTFCLFFCLVTSHVFSDLKSLYNSLDPQSIAQHFAFYELYPESPEGKLALRKAWKLLSQGKVISHIPSLSLPSVDIQAIISLITRQSFDAPVVLKDDQLELLEKIGSNLGNRKLKGHDVWTQAELLALPGEEIDLGRGLLINQFNERKEEIRQYEASLDLMALQVLARLPDNPTPEDKIAEINRFIFQEMQFRFPPHSLYAKDIDLYTFLPSVLDGREGVCLGVSILYLCIAQRLELPLEIITPPGHIYISYPGKELINIETTARGINLPPETYLGINTRRLEKRTMKEVIGMAFFNQASIFWGKEDYETTVSLYEKALPYLPNDPLMKMFMGINYLFVGRKSEGTKLLQEIRHLTFNWAVSPETIPEDYLSGKVDVEGLKVIFGHVDETRGSVLEKQKQLLAITKKYPQFRAGLLHLAITWLQLGRGSEGLEVLKQYHKVDPNNSTVEYYLTMLCIERFDYIQAWKFLKHTEEIVHARDHNPKALRSLHQSLKRLCPS